MRNILTLLSNPARPALNDEIVGIYAARLADVMAISWLSEGIAVDIFFDGVLAEARDALAPDLRGGNFDFCFQRAEGRVKKLLIADMDSTIITCECINELADFAGLKAKVSAITEAAMRGEMDFEETLRERVALLTGLEVSVLERVYRERVRLTTGAKTLIRTMNANGAMTLLVSGGFTYFTERIAEVTGFQVNRGNILEIKGGKLTGHVLPPIVDSGTKLDSLIEFRDKAGLADYETMAVGDGANDIAMIRRAGLGIAYHPHPAAAEAADMVIRRSDLTALLYMQGYCDEDFIGE